jgi:thioredoxin 1
MIELNEKNFNEAINDRIIVDFWAPWCGPCKMIAPSFEQLAKEYEGKLKFAKVNIDENEDLAQQMAVMSIPCLVIFDKRNELGRIVGGLPKDSLKKKIDEILSKKD